MKKSIILFFMAVTLVVPSNSQVASEGNIIQLHLTSQKVENTKDNVGVHRSPLRIPDVFFDKETGILYFEEPCYECTLELVIPGTEIVVYDSVIEDGADVIQLPNELQGTYELHIHRGAYCFMGYIDL